MQAEEGYCSGGGVRGSKRGYPEIAAGLGKLCLEKDGIRACCCIEMAQHQPVRGRILQVPRSKGFTNLRRLTQRRVLTGLTIGLEGRRFEGTSASPADPLVGDPKIDAALGAIRTSGAGHLGNFYWLPIHTTHPVHNPLEDEMHVIIVGSLQPDQFPDPQRRSNDAICTFQNPKSLLVSIMTWSQPCRRLTRSCPRSRRRPL